VSVDNFAAFIFKVKIDEYLTTVANNRYMLMLAMGCHGHHAWLKHLLAIY
jgi:hypothetical protein